MNKNIFKIKKKKRLTFIIVISFCLLFFFSSSIFPFFKESQGFVKFLSPDENANYIFSSLYQKEKSLVIFEPYNIIADDLLRPRSYLAHDDFVKPVSFLGIIVVYGLIASVFGSVVIPFLTPFFASLALLFYYLLVRKLFGARNALLSFFILFSFPVFFYYSARSMFHNVLFLSFLIISLYFLVVLLEKKAPRIKEVGKKYYKKIFEFDFLYSSLAGFFLGLSIAVRASELVWLAPAGLLFLLMRIKRFSFFRLAIFFSFAFLALLPFLYYNQLLYNSPFYGGYYEMNRSLSEISQAGGGMFKTFFSGHFSEFKNLAKSVFNTVFYFGFHPKQSFLMFYNYVIKMFWYIFWPAVLGAAYLALFKKGFYRKMWPYIIPWLVLSLILILYYGSWTFVDNPDPERVTIGNSYTRYWLPIYIALIPFASSFILIFTRIKKYLSIPLVLAIMIISFNFVWRGSEEGLNIYLDNLRIAKAEMKKIEFLSEENAVIITEYHDKFIFPERKVIVGRFNDNRMNQIYYDLSGYLPIYYYNFSLPEKDIEYLNNRRLKEFGLNISLVQEINENFSLYRIHRLYDL
jgi:hypothetical protein